MRYYIIFGITFVLLLFILFYNPYLGVYNGSVTIEYSFDDEDYIWSYEINNDSLVLADSTDNKWKFKPNKDGNVKLIYKYSNEDITKYTIEYEFKVKDNKIYWVDGVGYGLTDYPNPYQLYTLKF